MLICSHYLARVYSKLTQGQFLQIFKGNGRITPPITQKLVQHIQEQDAEIGHLNKLVTQHETDFEELQAQYNTLFTDKATVGTDMSLIKKN